jgi:hypothetical protein
VHADYLSEHKVVPADILIMSYGNRGWEALPTAFVRSSGNDFYFSADADRYSLLAVGNTKEGVSGLPGFTVARASSAPSPIATPVSPAAVPDTLISRAGQGIVSGPVTVSTTIAPPAPAGPATGFPFITAALIGMGGVGLVGCGMLVRRWWIRRQNPALFREYD